MGVSTVAIFKQLGKKRRKYPIKRDEDGKSARTRCFEYFEKKTPLMTIAEEVGVSIKTVYKYHQQWKINPRYEQQCAYLKSLLDRKSPQRANTLELLIRIYNIDRQQLEEILSQSHGLQRLLSGKILPPTKTEIERRRYFALELGWLISEHLNTNDGRFEDVLHAFEQFMEANKYYRQEDEEKTEFIRAILEVLDENERKGRGIRDRLTEEERDGVFRHIARVKKRQTEARYWLSIAGLMIGENLTLDQAR